MEGQQRERTLELSDPRYLGVVSDGLIVVVEKHFLA